MNHRITVALLGLFNVCTMCLISNRTENKVECFLLNIPITFPLDQVPIRTNVYK